MYRKDMCRSRGYLPQQGGELVVIHLPVAGAKELPGVDTEGELSATGMISIVTSSRSY